MSPYTIDGSDGQQLDETEETSQEWLDELVVLSFRENRRGGDPIAHTADGRAVFPDKFQGGDEILPGEHWICSVSQKGESTFFAAPVKRLDMELIAGLPDEERKRLAQIVAEDYPEAIDEQLQEFVPFGDGSSDLRRERDDLRERLLEINDQYDEALSRLSETEAELARWKKEKEAASGEDVEQKEAAEPVHAPDRDERFPVVREDGDVLYCEGFVDGHYHGHVSPNHRTLFFKSYGRGPLPCRDNRIEVPGLSDILPEDVEELEARYDPRHGGFFVEIPRG